MGPSGTNSSHSPLFPQQVMFPKATCRQRRRVDINEQCWEDLKFLLFVLQQCRNGIDQNLIAFRCPTYVYRSDSCPAGLGGYSNKRFAWRYYLPDNRRFWASNNLLEHLAAIITPWINILAGRLKKGDCSFSMTGSTTLEGCLRKTNLIIEGKDPIQATSKLWRKLLTSKEPYKLYLLACPTKVRC